MFKDDAYFYVSECDLEKLSEKYPESLWRLRIIVFLWIQDI